MHRVIRRRHVLTALLAAVIAVPVLFVSPASAHSGAVGYSYCAGSTLFGDLFSPQAAGLARGGDQAREPGLNVTVEEAPAMPGSNSLFAATIPVYFHIITPDGVIGNVSDAKVAEQIAVLNAGFDGSLGGVDTGFRFQLAGITRTTNAHWFDIKPGGEDEYKMKRTLRQGGANALNIYSNTAGAYLGWAYFPKGYASRPWVDGIVVDWESLPHVSSTYAGRFDLGYTVTHETGHWLGLYHTFQGGCNAKGDYIDDTPFELTPTSRCPAGKDTCPNPGLDPIHNFMDYSDDPCYTQFTAGQAERMQDQYLFYRASG
jgi:hypothetical protein